MTAHMVISFKSSREGRDIILNRIPVDYGNAETIKEKEKVHERLAGWLYTIHYPEIIATGREPQIYVEMMSEHETGEVDRDVIPGKSF